MVDQRFSNFDTVAPSTELSAQGCCETATARSDQDPVIDRETLAELRAVMGDKFPEILAQFREDIQRYSEEIIISIRQDNISEVCRLAHSMKSASKLFGALELSRQAQKVENQARRQMGGDTPGLEPALTLELQAYVKRSVSALDALAG